MNQQHLGPSTKRARVALFDFDGTISRIRSGWVEIMVPMMIEILLDPRTGERECALGNMVDIALNPLPGIR